MSMSGLGLLTLLTWVGMCLGSPVKQDGTAVEWKEAWSKLEVLEKQYLHKATGCQCVKYNCGCCLDIDVKPLHLDTSACVNAIYLPDQYGISLTFSLGGKVYINETISAKNPPPICVGIPEFEKDGSICIVFYNLDYTSSTFSGCIKLEAKLFHVKVQDLDLGCFSFPLAAKDGKSVMKMPLVAGVRKEGRPQRWDRL